MTGENRESLPSIIGFVVVETIGDIFQRVASQEKPQQNNQSKDNGRGYPINLNKFFLTVNQAAAPAIEEGDSQKEVGLPHYPTTER